MVTTRRQHQLQDDLAAFPEPKLVANGKPIPIDRTCELRVDSNGNSDSAESTTYNSDPDVPPTYTIDLSLPPDQRYIKLAADFKPRLRELTSLFDEVIESTGIENVERVRSLARLFLRGVYSREQTEELRGISRTIGVDMYLLVALNTLLDVLMGCTSGGARVRDESISRMLHFRVLDWGMDALRHVVVNLEFIQSPNSKVIARSVTYVGFVGVLTGVRLFTLLRKRVSFGFFADIRRNNLSVSLNVRPNHDQSSVWSELKFRGHHLLMLLGYRPTLSSILRSYIIPEYHHHFFSGKWYPSAKPLPDLETITKDFPSTPSTAAYIIASSGQVTTVFEKDRVTSNIRSSRSFIVATNHDNIVEPTPGTEFSKSQTPQARLRMEALMDLIADSTDRQTRLEKRWGKAKRTFKKTHPRTSGEDMYITQKELSTWLQEYPTTNESTHFACIMDPERGEMVWLRRWKDFVYDQSILVDPVQ